MIFKKRVRFQYWHWRGWQLAAFLLGSLLLALGAFLHAWPVPVESIDLEQTRLNVALPRLPAAEPIVQTLQPGHDGFVEVELLLARVAEGEEGAVALSLHDGQGRLVATQSWEAQRLTHNQPLVLRFPPQPDSAGQSYRLSLSGSQEVPFSFWGYDLDVYAGGALEAPVSGARELRFVTRYQLLPLPALRHLFLTLWSNSSWLLLALALILLPGLLLLLPATPRWDGAARWGVALALGVAVWPLLWYWLTVGGGRWRAWSLALFLVGGWLAVLLQWFRRRPRTPRLASVAHGSLLGMLVVAFAVRLLAVRDLFFPAWVDSTRHALITQVMATSGQIVRDYAPYLPVERFPYHFGFHTLSAGLTLLVNTELPTLLLILGQLLNALVPLTVYAATWLVTRRRTAGLLAAFLVAFPFYFPAYYTSWGRLTQLVGVLLLPVLLALTWRAAEGSSRRHAWWLVGLLAAGLALIHARVFLLYLPFVPVAWLVAGRGRGTRALAAATLLALLLAGPRLAEVWSIDRGTLSGAGATYNDFPVGYVTVGWEQTLLLAGGLALLLSIWPALRGRVWARFVLSLAGWSGIVLLLLYHAPSIWLINLNSAYITFFVPLALMLGAAGAAVEAWWRRLGPVSVPGYALLGAALGALFLFGARQQVDVLNPVTRLARPADAAGIAWVEENLPPDAKLAVNSWPWLGETWAGSDGGAWLLPLTGQMTTTPPADYFYDRRLFGEIAAFNDAAQAVEDWSDPAAAQWLAEEGVTHIFVGARGGFFDPAALARNPALTLLYARDGVFVFAL